MDRRSALSRISLIFGGTIVGADIFLYGCKADTVQLSNVEFTEKNILFLDEVGETIIPTSDSSPGAKAAQIGEFMKTIVTDCYEAQEQTAFLEGIGKLNDAAKESAGKGFQKLSPEEKKGLLTQLDKDAKAFDEAREDGTPNHYFTMMKQLTLWGYFSSEIGATQALRYEEVPGKWEACIPYEKGDRAWAI